MPNAFAKSHPSSMSGTFWSNLESDGNFRAQRCDDCGTWRFPPTTMCPHCHSVAFTWTAVSGDATLWTWTIVHRSPKPQFEDQVPYCLGVAELAEGLLVLGRIDTTALEGAKPAVGLALTLVVDPPSGETPARYHFRASGADPV